MKPATELSSLEEGDHFILESSKSKGVLLRKSPLECRVLFYYTELEDPDLALFYLKKIGIARSTMIKRIRKSSIYKKILRQTRKEMRMKKEKEKRDLYADT